MNGISSQNLQFLKSFLIIDIETVSEKRHFYELSPEKQQLWRLKVNSKFRISDPKLQMKAYSEKAGIFAEFGKIIVISLGFIYPKDSDLHLKIINFKHHNESELLKSFFEFISRSFDPAKLSFGAHNGKEFDLPFICRRASIMSLPLPSCLQLSGLKPWQNPHVDTLEDWKYGDFKHYTSLNLLTHIHDIPSPKNQIDGSQVGNVYYKAGNLDKIADYCAQDVLATARLYTKIKFLKNIEQGNVQFTTFKFE
ncbi:MAG: ribonuclease H-like domain-containing protein [Cyclobacteriaceae bacterium]|nr:ribonuclease H-like domain-containing protein [Cyclobacteriaceae bacterium]MCH8514697.1 ribonuclease H-like domain-containing protein [Cyclobacteriaceae bacterium]